MKLESFTFWRALIVTVVSLVLALVAILKYGRSEYGQAAFYMAFAAWIAV